jgi:uncharacterized protein (TIGR02001 family)
VRSAGTSRQRVAERRACWIGRIALVSAVLWLSPAHAEGLGGQFGARIAIESDLRWRGFSLSAGDPVTSLDLTYDSPSGTYLGGTVIAQWRGEPRYLGFVADGGVARRLGGRWSLDVGAEHAEYEPAYPSGPRYSYTEVHVGVTRAPVLARISYSPDYFGDKVRTVYLETEGAVRLPASFQLSGHAGVLVVVDQPPYTIPYRETQYDWRVAVSRAFGNAEAHLAVSGGGPTRDYYEDTSHSRTAVTVGASVSF